MEESDVLIVGGGIAGLACAVALADAGLRVRVLEATTELGGRARSWTHGPSGDRVDIGPHILLTEYRNMLRLLERLGTRDQVTWETGRLLTLVDPPGEPAVMRVAGLPPPLHLAPSMLAMDRFTLRELATNWRTAWRVARLDPESLGQLDAIDAETMLRRDGVSEHVLDWHWRSACMTAMNVPLERCSAASLLQVVRYVAGVRAHFGFPAIGLGDLFVPGAVAAIEAGRGQVDMQADVEALVVDGDTVRGVRLRDGGTLRARWCVSAVPPQALASLLPPAWRGASPFDGLHRFQPSPYISTYLWYRRRLTDRRFWSNVWSPGTRNYDFYDLANIRPGHRGGSLIASNIIDSSRFAPMDDEEVIATTRRELAMYLPDSAGEVPVHASVHRIPMAIPAPHPGTESARPAPETPIHGLLLAGDWLHTGLPATMESAVRAAWLAAERILEQAGRRRELASPLPEMQGLMRLVAGGRLHASRVPGR